MCKETIKNEGSFNSHSIIRNLRLYTCFIKRNVKGKWASWDLMKKPARFGLTKIKNLLNYQAILNKGAFLRRKFCSKWTQCCTNDICFAAICTCVEAHFLKEKKNIYIFLQDNFKTFKCSTQARSPKWLFGGGGDLIII